MGRQLDLYSAVKRSYIYMYVCIVSKQDNQGEKEKFRPGLDQGAVQYPFYADLWQVLSPPCCLDLGSQIFSRGLRNFS